MKLLDLQHRHLTCPLKGTWGLLTRESRNAETAIWARKLIGLCCRARAGGKGKYHECRHGCGAWQGQPRVMRNARLCHAARLYPAPTRPQELLLKTSVIQPKCSHQGQGGERKWSPGLLLYPGFCFSLICKLADFLQCH